MAVRFQFIVIHSRRRRSPGIVEAVPLHLMRAGRPVTLYQVPYNLPLRIVYPQTDRPAPGQTKGDECTRVERVRIVRFQREPAIRLNGHHRDCRGFGVYLQSFTRRQIASRKSGVIQAVAFRPEYPILPGKARGRNLHSLFEALAGGNRIDVFPYGSAAAVDLE